MKTIYKYTLNNHYITKINIPRGGEILDVQLQNNYCRMWVKVDNTQPTEKREFRIVATGEEIRDAWGRLEYIKTYQDNGFVGHIFEVLKYKSKTETQLTNKGSYGVGSYRGS